jgi:hypothetical protein
LIESPCIAAFFAFWEKSNADDVAILAYIESIDGGLSLTGGAPMISVQGPYVTTHQRHFAQKIWYTIATQWDEKRKETILLPWGSLSEAGPRPGHPDQDRSIQ